MTRMMIRPVFLFLVLGLITACDTTVEPRTGERTTRWTLPGTEANEASFQERWRRCTQFRSPSVCEQRMGRRPLRSTATTPHGDVQEPQPDGHP